MATFKAIRIDKADKGTTAALTQFDDTELMDGDVTVRVEWSTLNYKDGLALTGKAPVVRRFPMIAGIDFAGTVEQSSHPDWKAGDKVVCNGWGMGETHLGAYAEKARVKGDWLVRLPDGISARDAMAVGTAGYTAMLSVLALEKHGLTPKSGPVVVTGAAGGVGSVAIAVMAVEARLPRHRLDGPDVGGRLSQGARCHRGDRPRRAVGCPQGACEGALGRRRRQRRVDHARQSAFDDQVWRRHSGLRPGGRHGPAVVGRALHFARCVPSRHRFRDVPDRASQDRLAPPCQRSG
ncbi:hypothetical protein ACVWY2_003799 [Bradyrhizobium sp. JR6.1]